MLYSVIEISKVGKKRMKIKFQAFVASRPKKVKKIITVTEARKIVQERIGS